MLQIKTTDEANNKAIRSHDFSVNFLVNQFKIVEKLVKYAFDLLYNYEEWRLTYMPGLMKQMSLLMTCIYYKSSID